MLDTKGYKHTLRIRNIYRFFPATIVTPTRQNIMICVHFQNSTRKSGYNTYRGRTQIEYQNKHYDVDQKNEGTLDDRRRDGGTKFILRIKEEETHLTLQEHDDDGDDDDDHDDDVHFRVFKVINHVNYN